MVEEWCGDSGGRLIPLCLIPLWDVEKAAAEVRRNATRGVRAVCFSEIPPHLGPAEHPQRVLGPVLRRVRGDRTVVCMHIGSSSKMPATSADAPVAVAATLSFGNAMSSLCDFLFSGVLVRFPQLVLAYSEGQIGWLPYILERADDVWREHRAWGGVKDIVPEPPSTYFQRQVYGCFFRDQHGLDSIGVIGADRITFETDYPHTDSTWPDTKTVAEDDGAVTSLTTTSTRSCGVTRSRCWGSAPPEVEAAPGSRASVPRQRDERDEVGEHRGAHERAGVEHLVETEDPRPRVRPLAGVDDRARRVRQPASEHQHEPGPAEAAHRAGAPR